MTVRGFHSAHSTETAGPASPAARGDPSAPRGGDRLPRGRGASARGASPALSFFFLFLLRVYFQQPRGHIDPEKWRLFPNGAKAGAGGSPGLQKRSRAEGAPVPPGIWVERPVIRSFQNTKDTLLSKQSKSKIPRTTTQIKETPRAEPAPREQRPCPSAPGRRLAALTVVTRSGPLCRHRVASGCKVTFGYFS